MLPATAGDPGAISTAEFGGSTTEEGHESKPQAADQEEEVEKEREELACTLRVPDEVGNGVRDIQTHQGNAEVDKEHAKSGGADLATEDNTKCI